ncbi:MAG TPA: hypothetical protein PLH94_08820 [Fimbriimonadaceae bacterium]|nr:hypothetical protein [Fimbriimonadaceae bacterium]
MGYLVLVVLALATLGVLLWGRRSRRPKFFARAEYWVYVPGTKLPKQDELMTRMVAENPLHRLGKPPIGAREGLLFSDIRLHLAMAIRSKNPHIFRPDLFDTEVTVTPEVLAGLAASHGMVKVRYVSEVPLKDLRHLQFLPHMAEAVSALADGQVVFDPVQEKLWTAEAFRDALATQPNWERFDAHARTIWVSDDVGGRAKTLGMSSIGLADLESDPSPLDHETLVLELVEEAASRLFAMALEGGSPIGIPATIEIERYDDTFLLDLTPERERIGVHIRRRSSV